MALCPAEVDLGVVPVGRAPYLGLTARELALGMLMAFESAVAGSVRDAA